jgi:hypothetical protein
MAIMKKEEVNYDRLCSVDSDNHLREVISELKSKEKVWTPHPNFKHTE